MKRPHQSQEEPHEKLVACTKGYVLDDIDDDFNDSETNPITRMDVLMGVGRRGHFHFGNMTHCVNELQAMKKASKNGRM
jgi:dTDP-4-dehydrorhamnose 3,5-epimerase-like enzyme